ncbi:MAG: DUF4054 domain-containing protein [Devosia sp.]|uniref:DUF4054 domain-containing protein n=1 Tax=Devosia sp. TaxID=1871048 RepID=UPI003399FA4F
MAYTAPTPTDLKLRHPEFAAVEDAQVQYWLTDAAARHVDTSWIEADYAVAIIEAACHEMARGGVLTSGATAIPAGVTSFRSGSFSVSMSDAAATASAEGGWASTRYGKAYLAILRRNKGGPLVTTSGVAPGYACCGGLIPPYVS